MRTDIIGKLLQPYWRLTRSVTLGAQGIVLDNDYRVLLVRHSYRPGWHFPGGGVERGENVELSLSRELREEAGVVLTGPPELHGVFTNFKYFRNDHILVYVVRRWEQPTIPKPNAEIRELGFYPHDALPPDTVEGARNRLAEIFDDRPKELVWR